MPDYKDSAIGVIVYRQFPRSLKFLIVKHKKGHWSFAKGHKDKGETMIQTAKRELLEETGLKGVEFLSKKVLLKEEYYYSEKDRKKISKIVRYFVAKTKTEKIKIDNKEIINYKWCTIKAARKKLTYAQSRKLVKDSVNLILKKSKKT